MSVSGVDQVPLPGLNNYTGTSTGSFEQKEIAKTDRSLDKREQSKYCSQQQLDQSVEVLNKTMDTYKTDLKFELHQESGEYMVKVLKESDGTVIREIPPKEVLDMVAHFKKLLGIIVDKLI